MKNKTPLVAKASRFVFKLISGKLSSSHLYHNFRHAYDTAAVCAEMADYYKLERDEAEELLLAAWFHDAGYTVSYRDHEEKSADIAKQFLNEENFPRERTAKVISLIASTRKGENPDNLCERILHDADYAGLGRKSFIRKAELLRSEWESLLQKKYSDLEWARLQLEFLTEKNFRTEYAQKKFSNRRAQNILELKREIEKLEASPETEKRSRGVETMFRTTYRNHINLSSIADSKANMMISINTILMSIIITVVGSGFTFGYAQNHLRFIVPVSLLLVACLSSVVFAVLSASPNVTTKNVDMKSIEANKSSVLFFGNFSRIPLGDFIHHMNVLMKKQDLLYDNMTVDIYFLGHVLTRKYSMLRYSYFIFLSGLVLSVLSFLFVFLFFPVTSGN